jgi:hypothetical protein
MLSPNLRPLTHVATSDVDDFSSSGCRVWAPMFP